MNNFSQIMKQAKVMQEKMAEVQKIGLLVFKKKEELHKITATISF